MARKRTRQKRASPPDTEKPEDEGQHGSGQTTQTGSTRFGRWSKKLASHPLFIIAVGLASCAGLITGAVFFKLSLRSPELVVYEQPTRTILAQDIGSGQLSIKYRDTPIKSGHLIAAHFTIWNNGRLATEAGDILKEFRFITSPPAPILDATVMKCTREECQVRVNADRAVMDQGQLPISWRILEKNDAAQIQIVFDGDPKTVCTLEGTIKAQGAPRAARLTRDSFASVARQWALFLVILLFIIVAMARSLARLRRAARETAQQSALMTKNSADRLETVRACAATLSKRIVEIRASLGESNADMALAHRALQYMEESTAGQLDLVESVHRAAREFAEDSAKAAVSTVRAAKKELVTLVAMAMILLALICLYFGWTDSVPFLP